jgi:fused signal recognition particle receptor
MLYQFTQIRNRVFKPAHAFGRSQLPIANRWGIIYSDMAIAVAQSIKNSLTRTRNAVFSRVAGLFGASEVTADTWDELEELLIQADVGVETTLYLVDRLRRRASGEAILKADVLQAVLWEELRALLPDPAPLNIGGRPLDVILIVGVNGSGKTTSIAKLAYHYRCDGRRVLLAAADTFRAAAMDQLEVWAKRAGVDIVTGPEGGDPGAVVYDALQAARSRGMDMVIVDTAGRLHTQYNLMAELRKVRKVASQGLDGAPHETLLVLDAATGQNALSQARHFREAVEVTGVMLAKLDGTARGGMVFAIARELGLPVRFVGTGEAMEDLAPFDADVFVEGLLG